MEEVILVDEKDNQIGLMEKIEAHRKGLLHRAFSGFVFNEKNELLLQRRAFEKYHNGGLWSNTVCSHPRDKETNLKAVSRRIFEEFGFECKNFEEMGHFTYKIEFSNGLIENEYDYIFFAKYNNQKINPNPNEICDYKWISKVELEKEIKENPENYTFWLKQILKLNLWK